MKEEYEIGKYSELMELHTTAKGTIHTAFQNDKVVEKLGNDIG